MNAESLNLPKLTEEVRAIARSAGAFLLAELGKVGQEQIETKALNSLVSYVDRTAEEQIVAALQPLLPAAGFLTEEETVAQLAQPTRWIIDPLDGTTNFLYGVPIFSVSIALEIAGELVLGVVYEPNRDECFYAWRGGGAWCNERPIRVRQQANLAQALLATGFPYYDYSRMGNYLQLFRYLMENTRGLRRCGSAAVDLAYVAAGRFDGFYEYSLSAWDIAAGMVLVREAGGTVTNFSGQDTSLQTGEILAASNGIYPHLLTSLKQRM
ncbi:MAG: inositol monophosphatase family protein [Bacteroidota bacterium]